jgi:hypothetical protein
VWPAEASALHDWWYWRWYQVLNQCEIGDPGVASLSTALAAGSGNATLQTLRLRNNHLMDGAAADLAALLKTSKPCALTELDLSWNSLGPDGAVSLSHALRANCPLRSLHLEWNGLETKGGSALASVLHKNNRLQMLNLSHTRAGPEVRHLLESRRLAMSHEHTERVVDSQSDPCERARFQTLRLGMGAARRSRCAWWCARRCRATRRCVRCTWTATRWARMAAAT